MDINYIGTGSNNANGFQIDRYFLDTCNAYTCYNLRLKKVVESINVTIDETGRWELKEEENESMEQLYEEEA